jgi:hypothetical protein
LFVEDDGEGEGRKGVTSGQRSRKAPVAWMLACPCLGLRTGRKGESRRQMCIRIIGIREAKEIEGERRERKESFAQSDGLRHGSYTLATITHLCSAGRSNTVTCKTT